MKRIISVMFMFLVILSMSGTAFADTTTIISDTSLMVYGPLDEYKPLGDAAWGAPVQAVLTWVHPSWPTLDPASWISNSYLIEGNVSGSTWRLFRKTVNLCEGAYDISGTITATSDNAEEVYVNGAFVGSDGELQGPFEDNLEWKTLIDYNYVATGDTLVFDFIVRNYPGSDNPQSNPTGLIFSATINNSCPVEVVIDIKPGSFPSCLNNNGNGLIPVAIFGDGNFDVYDVDVSSLDLEGLTVALKPNGRYMAAYQDVNADGQMDLVVKFNDLEGVFDPGDEYATLTGNLLDGTPFFGVGDICIRP